MLSMYYKHTNNYLKISSKTSFPVEIICADIVFHYHSTNLRELIPVLWYQKPSTSFSTPYCFPSRQQKLRDRNRQPETRVPAIGNDGVAGITGFACQKESTLYLLYCIYRAYIFKNWFTSRYHDLLTCFPIHHQD